MKTTSYVKLDDVNQMLHDLEGCEDNFSTLAFGSDEVTWANGWNKAIEVAIRKLDKLSAVDLAKNSMIYLKPCPFCGRKKITSKLYKQAFCEYRFEISCSSCNHAMFIDFKSATYAASLDEILTFSHEAADKWNRRYNERKEIESEAEENA